VAVNRQNYENILYNQSPTNSLRAQTSVPNLASYLFFSWIDPHCSSLINGHLFVHVQVPSITNLRL